MILSCSSLTKSYLGKDVLKDVSFKLEEHDKLAIIGVNGAGKSTLLRILQEEEHADSGEISFNKNMKLGYLSQEHAFDLEKSIYDTLKEPFEDLIVIEKRMRELESLMSTS
ncbi:MAG TPA: ABC transporter, partial [Kandleria vitulina]|nr:ABC transporter [Kandleria vitulina]HCY53071.1 ABC transporter [Kandleria vitulina]